MTDEHQRERGGACMSYLDADFLARNLVLGNIYRDPAVWRKDVCMLDLGKFKILVTMHMGIFRETGMLARTWVGYKLGICGM